MTKRNAVNNKAIHPLLRSLLITSLFCTAIAIMTTSVWDSPFYEHLLISLGYGYSAVICSFLLETLFTDVKKAYLTLIAMILSIALGTLHAFYWLNKYDDFATLETLKPVVLLGLLFTAICFYFFHTHEQKLLADQALEMAKRKQSEQEKSLLLSQLNQLQSQIEPHFLFNTLANISALIELDNQKAKCLIEKLTDLLRASLNTTRSTLTTVQQESDLLSAYLGIQQIRLGERLTYRINNQLDQHIMLPPLLIQPLVENAVSHGIEPSSRGGEVTVNFTQKEGAVVIEVVDTGLGLSAVPSSRGNGISLNNIQQRLRELFNGKAQLMIKENDTVGVTATITIPSYELDLLKKDYS